MKEMVYIHENISLGVLNCKFSDTFSLYFASSVNALNNKKCSVS